MHGSWLQTLLLTRKTARQVNNCVYTCHMLRSPYSFVTCLWQIGKCFCWIFPLCSSTEWLGLEVTVKITQFQPLLWAGCPSPAQAAQGPPSLALSTFKGGVPTALWQLCHHLTNLWKERFLLVLHLNLSSFMDIALCLITTGSCKPSCW